MSVKYNQNLNKTHNCRCNKISCSTCNKLNNNSNTHNNYSSSDLVPFLGNSHNNRENDVLLNPYIPPLRDERYLVPSLNYIPPGAVPINISTNVGAVDTNYRQVGILTPLNSSSKDSILPLMGRPLFTNRDKWQYYTISNQHNNVKLPVSKGGRSCTNEYGCDKIYNGDSIYIEGVNDAYKVTVYDNDVIKYLPFV
jgi:hypothetical protein